MRKRLGALIAAAIVPALAAAIPAHASSGQAGQDGGQAGQHHPYTLVGPGTFGGPQSFLNLPAIPFTGRGGLLGTADTTVRDPDYPNFNPFIVGFADRHLVHAFAWKNGRLRDLGALPGKHSSAVFEVNDRGVGAGMSDTAITDPYTHWPADHAVLFKNGRVTDLGTLRGGYESQANDINDRGQVSGFASNGKKDRYSILGWGTQTRSFVWQHGVLRDIGTLGGPDALSVTMNASGEIVGQSYANSSANAVTKVPTQDPFLWRNGQMTDLGTLGGTFGTANWLNDAGQVVGQSNLAGDQSSHPYLWRDGTMTDLGTLGGDNGFANWVSDRGSNVAGDAQTSSGAFRAFWWHHGTMTGLPPTGGAPWSFAQGVNDSGLVVGGDSNTKGQELAAVAWAGGRSYDLNTLIAPSRLHLAEAEYVDNRGDIVGHGVLPNGDQRVFLLVRNRSVPLPSTAPSAQPLPATGPAGQGTAAVMAVNAARRGGIATAIRHLRNS
jgi:probable HAF family extracellular repeat protein